MPLSNEKLNELTELAKNIRLLDLKMSFGAGKTARTSAARFPRRR